MISYAPGRRSFTMAGVTEPTPNPGAFIMAGVFCLIAQIADGLPGTPENRVPSPTRRPHFLKNRIRYPKIKYPLSVKYD